MQIKYFLLSLSFGCLGKIPAQNRPAYPDSVQKRIEAFENNLPGWVQAKGVKSSWTLLDRMKHYHVNGLSIAVIHNYRLEWARGYGWADAARQIPVTPRPLFQAASLSKSLNAIAVLKLVQQKKINLCGDIDSYLKSWHLPADDSSPHKRIMVYNLLNHTAGINVHGFPGYRRGDKLPSIVQILNGEKPANTEAIKLIGEPGTTVDYSGGGVEIAQMILMDITHNAYDKYQQEQVLNALGMTNSFFTQPPPVKNAALLATAYDRDGKELDGRFHIYPELAAAGLWTTPTDLSKFIIELQLAYAQRKSKVLTQSAAKEMVTPFPGSDVGLGVFVDTIGDRVYFKHGGANDGFRSQYFGSLTGGDGVVVMVNSDQDVIIHDVVNGIAQVYDWQGFSKMQTRSVIQPLNTLLQSYVGTYVLGNEKINVVGNNGHLYLSLNGSAPMQMYFTSGTDFFVAEIEMHDIRFEKASDSKGYALVLKSGEKAVRFLRREQ